MKAPMHVEEVNNMNDFEGEVQDAVEELVAMEARPTFDSLRGDTEVDIINDSINLPDLNVAINPR